MEGLCDQNIDPKLCLKYIHTGRTCFQKSDQVGCALLRILAALPCQIYIYYTHSYCLLTLSRGIARSLYGIAICRYKKTGRYFQINIDVSSPHKGLFFG